MNKKIIYLLMFFFLIVTSFYITKKINKKDPIVNTTGLVLKDLNGNFINLNSFYGKPIILNYWASWCGPCREEFPIFEKINKKYSSQVNFLMVSAEPLDKIIEYKRINKYSLPFAQSQQQLNQLGITSIPVTAIYSAEGKLLTTKFNPLNEAQLHEIISGLLKN